MWGLAVTRVGPAAALSESDARVRPVPVFRATSMRTLLALLLVTLGVGCASSPEADPFAVEKAVAYGDDPRQVGDLFRPRGAGPFPAVVLIHGGSWARGDREDMAGVARRFAASGYVVWNINYRLAPEHTFPAQLEDARAALAWLHERAATLSVDPERIAVMGYSAGGHLALLLGLDEAEPAPAVVASGAGPTDLRVYPRSPAIQRLLGGELEERPDLWKSASPITHVTPDDPPVVLYHGALDALVGIEQSRSLAARLRAEGVTSRLIEQPWTGHMTAFLFDDASIRGVLDFFDQHLR